MGTVLFSGTASTNSTILMNGRTRYTLTRSGSFPEAYHITGVTYRLSNVFSYSASRSFYFTAKDANDSLIYLSDKLYGDGTSASGGNINTSLTGNLKALDYYAGKDSIQVYVQGGAYDTSDTSSLLNIRDGCKVEITVTFDEYKKPVLDNAKPANAGVVVGNSATFAVEIATAGVPATYTYQWYLDSDAISGATSASLTHTFSTAGTYSIMCAVTSAAGTVYSRSASVQVGTLPVLNSAKPANVTTKLEKQATFEVAITTAGNPATYTYQWYKDNAAVSGATSATFTTSFTTIGTHRVYCKVSSAVGSVNSRTATVTVGKKNDCTVVVNGTAVPAEAMVYHNGDWVSVEAMVYHNGAWVSCTD